MATRLLEPLRAFDSAAVPESSRARRRLAMVSGVSAAVAPSFDYFSVAISTGQRNTNGETD